MLSIQLVTRGGTKIAYSCLTAELQNIATQKLPMNRNSLLLVTCATVLIAAVVPVQAGPILQPAAATASSQFSGVFGDPANAISQSGLSVGYTSLVTEWVEQGGVILPSEGDLEPTMECELFCAPNISTF